MKKKNQFFISLIALTLTSCSNASIDLADELSHSYTNDGKMITAEGLLSTGFLVWGDLEHMEVINMYLTATSTLDNTKSASIRDIKVKYGEGKNSVVIHMPAGKNEFTDKDVVIYDKEGRKLSPTDKVKITGLVTYTAKGPKKETKSKFGIKPNVDFNKKKDKDDDGNDYTYTVTNVVIEKL